MPFIAGLTSATAAQHCALQLSSSFISKCLMQPRHGVSMAVCNALQDLHRDARELVLRDSRPVGIVGAPSARG